MRRFWFVFLVLLTIIIPVSIQTPRKLSAQSGLPWSLPQRIPGYPNDADPPYLVADLNRTVHALGSQKVGGDLDIFYSRWTLGMQWTYPVDILLSPNGRQANMLGAFLDHKGMLHVAFYGGFEKGEIYYSRAAAIEADDARAWSWPKNVGARAVSPAAGTLQGDAEGNLFILYNGNVEGNGLYEIHSFDGGDTWSLPVLVFSTETGVSGLQAIVDYQGRLHAVWTEYNRGGTGEAVYYARLEPDHQRWSLPLRIRSRRDCVYEADWASIAANKDELVMLYNCDQPPHEWMNRSTDAGKTWSPPVLVFPGLRGENGPTSLLVDSNNVIHALIPKRTDDERIHALWHSEWNGKQWTTPVVAVPSVPTMGPSYIKGIISQGNVILVVMRNDLGATESGPWYSYTVTNSPALPTVIVPKPVITLAVPATLTATPRILPSPTRLENPAYTPQSGAPAPPMPANNPTMGLIVAIIPVALLLAIVAMKLMQGKV